MKTRSEKWPESFTVNVKDIIDIEPAKRGILDRQKYQPAYQSILRKLAIYRLSKCPSCGYYAFNGQECYDCGYTYTKNLLSANKLGVLQPSFLL